MSRQRHVTQGCKTLQTDLIAPLDNDHVDIGPCTFVDTVTFSGDVTVTGTFSLAPKLGLGGLIGYSNIPNHNAELAAGSNTQLLFSDNTTPTGLAWKYPYTMKEIVGQSLLLDIGGGPFTPCPHTSLYGNVILPAADREVRNRFTMPRDWVVGTPIALYMNVQTDAADPGPGVTVHAEFTNTISINNASVAIGAGVANTFTFVPSSPGGAIAASWNQVHPAYDTTLQPAGISMAGMGVGASVDSVLVRTGGAGDDYASTICISSMRLRYQAHAVDNAATLV